MTEVSQLPAYCLLSTGHLKPNCTAPSLWAGSLFSCASSPLPHLIPKTPDSLPPKRKESSEVGEVGSLFPFLITIYATAPKGKEPSRRVQYHSVWLPYHFFQPQCGPQWTCRPHGNACYLRTPQLLSFLRLLRPSSMHQSHVFSVPFPLVLEDRPHSSATSVHQTAEPSISLLRRFTIWLLGVCNR